MGDHAEETGSGAMVRISRAQRVAEVERLRAKGATNAETASAIGVSLGYVRHLINDPAGTKVRARKARLAGVCADCGGPTRYQGGRPARRCAACVRADLLPCGTVAAYARGCRCPACRAANAAHAREMWRRYPAIREANRRRMARRTGSARPRG
jgi:hypothetical protein